MAAKLSERGRFTAAERQRYDADGFLVREAVFDARERGEIIDACESLVVRLISNRKENRVKASNYVFDSDLERETMIKWEGDSDVVHGIEPFAHLSPELTRWAYDARFVEPMKDLIGCDDPRLYTEKLNLKRPRVGGFNPLHQDFPYWERASDGASDIYTAMLFLDDSNLANGCLWAIPGSHKAGKWKTRSDGDRFSSNEVDVAAYPNAKAVPLEVPAGSIVFFGAFLVHRSEGNTSDKERRALLYSYQPPGRRSQLDNFRESVRRAQERQKQEQQRNA